VIPYFSETLTYSSGIDEPLRSASDSSRKNVGGALSNLHKGQIFATADRTHSHSTKEPPDLTKREVRPRGNLNRADGCQTPLKMLSGAEADPPMHLVGLAVCLRGVIRE
jgi:hypothetical protein